MSIEIWHDQGLYQNSTSTSVECMKNEEMQVGLYTLQNKESINIVPDDYEVTSTFIVLEGKLNIYSANEVHELNTHDMAMLTNIEESYYAEAAGFVKLVIITSEANQDAQEDESVAMMLSEVEKKDVYTLGHSRRVSLYAKRLALAYESTYHVVALSMAGSTHDIGKIDIPIEILQKPSKLSEEEYAIVKLHPIISYDILKEKLGERVAIAARQHHERLDGSGYPYGLVGNEICMDARIIAVADVFDAMTCKRIYNQPLSPLEVVAYLEDNLDKYDASIVAILRRKVEKGELDDILTAFVA